ncbi:MAG: TIGR00730 family Rossman fold protein [Pseudomonadota bacterium]
MNDDLGRPEKAYKDQDFMRGQDGRPLRMLAEYLEPKARFERYRVDDTIVFYGSARIPSRETAEAEVEKAKANGGDMARAEKRLELSAYYEASRALAHRLTEWSKSLDDVDRRFVICTGGGPGIMEAANRGASEAKGINIGLGISLNFEEPPNPYVTRELAFTFHYFFMRKFWFAYHAKAIVVMPGGFGTLDELFELLTLVQTGRIRKRMPTVLFGKDYWSKVLNLETLVEYGTISPTDLDLFILTDSVDEAFDYVTHELKAHALESPGLSL